MTKCLEAPSYFDDHCRGCGAVLQLVGLQWCGICRQKRVHEGLEAPPYDEAMSDKRRRGLEYYGLAIRPCEREANARAADWDRENAHTGAQEGGS